MHDPWQHKIKNKYSRTNREVETQLFEASYGIAEQDVPLLLPVAVNDGLIVSDFFVSV